MIAISVVVALATAPLPSAATTFIKQRLGLTHYKNATADLNQDGRPEIFVYATDNCGSGGCDLYVLSPKAGTYRIVMLSSITQLPIRMLPTSTRGWRDIGVTVQGGGILVPYMARMRFNGRRYPSNPTVPPAVRVRPSGKVLIGH